MSEPGSDSMATVIEIMHALDRDQMTLVFQPVVPMRARRRVVFEALLRWNHPQLGVLTPDAFLPSMTSSGLRAEVTSWVLHRAADACRGWLRRGWDAGVGVNVWPTDLMHPRVLESLGVITSTLLDPDRLTIEVTETGFPLDDVGMADALFAVSQLGVHLSLDDFGTGDSSLTRLQQLQFDDLKIDRRFVTAVAASPTDRAIVGFSIQLAHTLSMSAVAEGVETPEAAAVLQAFGVDALQGFLYARPLPAPHVDLPPVPPE